MSLTFWVTAPEYLVRLRAYLPDAQAFANDHARALRQTTGNRLAIEGMRAEWRADDQRSSFARTVGEEIGGVVSAELDGAYVRVTTVDGDIDFWREDFEASWQARVYTEKPSEAPPGADEILAARHPVWPKAGRIWKRGSAWIIE
jgi:hypothetical protein